MAKNATLQSAEKSQQTTIERSQGRYPAQIQLWLRDSPPGTEGVENIDVLPRRSRHKIVHCKLARKIIVYFFSSLT